MIRLLAPLLLAPLVLGSAAPAFARTPATAQTPAAAPAAAPAPAAVDYTADASWLCRPGRNDACTVDQTTTVVAANGTTTVQPFAALKDPRVDCFYVYPTVSTDAGGNSDLTVDPAERRVVEQQLARFASQCRLYAPLYRQITLAALRSTMTGGGIVPNREMAYGDVATAWKDYLARDNKGRGVVLIGHSQGARMLQLLVQAEIDGKPVQKQLVSAMLLGFNLAVPAGKDVGGDFRTVPLCRSETQTGCAVSYVSFRADAPPPADSRFGRAAAAGSQVACTNPAALGGGKAALDAYMPGGTSRIVDNAEAPKPWATGLAVATPFVRTPGLVSGECVNEAGASYLAVTTNADPADPRTDRIPGDVVIAGRTYADWGLHLIDMNVAMGDLVKLVGTQSKAYLAKR